MKYSMLQQIIYARQWTGNQSIEKGWLNWVGINSGPGDQGPGTRGPTG